MPDQSPPGRNSNRRRRGPGRGDRGPDPRGPRPDAPNGDRRGPRPERGGGPGRAPDAAGPPRPSKLVASITKPRRLNLDLPVFEPLGPEEVSEMSEHLAFLKRYKAVLGLSLNAAEDLLVNGVKPPGDRGVCKHLLSKVDRKLIERVVAKEAVQRDPGLRARLLAGVVRLNADVGMLLSYLDALAGLTDKREAAAAFALTVDRIDFAAISNAQMATLLDVIGRTFAGHDRTQALFGLLGSESFEQTLTRALPSLPTELRDAVGALRAAHNHVMLGLAPVDDAEAALVAAGTERWLSAPEAVLRSYTPEVRERLAQVAATEADLATHGKAAHALIDSLPHDSAGYAKVATGLAERLVIAEREDAARALYAQVLQAHPKLTRAARCRDALAWPRIGRLAVPAGGGDRSGRLTRAFWLDHVAFVLVRTVPRRDADRLQREAALQSALVAPGIAVCLASGTAPDGSAYVVLEPGGRPLDARSLDRWSLADVLTLTAGVARILLITARAGIELPDAAPARFLVESNAPTSVRLADFDGATSTDPERALARHAELARDIVRGALSAQGSEVPSGLRPALRDEVPLAELVRGVALEAARAGDE